MGIEGLPAELTPPGVVVVAGPLGSGKTEFAVNLSLWWAKAGPTYLADLDVLTPYFRSRDARAALEAAGVRVLAPNGQAGAYDVPVLPREVVTVLADSMASVAIDVGGHPQGAGVLAHYREALLGRSAKLLLVVNPRRPGSDRPGPAVELGRRISAAAGLPLSGIIANGNLGAHTTLVDVEAGLVLAREIGRAVGVPVLAVACPADLTEACRQAAGDVPTLGLFFYMRPVWESTGDRQARTPR